MAFVGVVERGEVVEPPSDPAMLDGRRVRLALRPGRSSGCGRARRRRRKETTVLTTLERTIPVYDFQERHSRWIDADPERVWHALTTLTLDQLPITRPLVAIRHLGGGGAATGVGRNLFTEGPLRLLEVTPPSYAVGGAVARPWQRRPQRRSVASVQEFAAFAEPGWVKYLTDFHLQPRDGGVQLTTVTRGRSTDGRARLRFAPYWALIRPASGLIRRDVLAAVARSARGGTERSRP